MTDCTFEYDPPGQTLRCVCAYCGHVSQSHHPRHLRRRKCSTPSPRTAPPSSDCIHRGPQTGEEPRVCCGGEPLIVYECGLFHESVTLRKARAGKTDRLRDCLSCDQKPPL